MARRCDSRDPGEVRRDGGARPACGAGFRRIVVALDGEMDSPVLEAAIAPGSLNPQSRYFLTRVVEPTIPILTPLAARPVHLGPHENERREIEARNYLADIADQLQRQGLRVTPQVLVGRGVAEQVLELAYALGADCIVVGTHGLRGAERVFIGSVADKIIRGADVPVLVSPTRSPAVLTAPFPARLAPGAR